VHHVKKWCRELGNGQTDVHDDDCTGYWAHQGLMWMQHEWRRWVLKPISQNWSPPPPPPRHTHTPTPLHTEFLNLYQDRTYGSVCWGIMLCFIGVNELHLTS
jgi:hypothetical protein